MARVSKRATRAVSRRRQALERLEGRTLLAAHIVGDPTVYQTIQAAVNAAKPNAVINVDPGSYAEMVTINTPLTLRGAEAGVDGRSNQRGTNETVITGIIDPVSGNTISTIDVNASGVTVDGFVVQGNTSNGNLGAGIVMSPGVSGTTVINNILQSNVAGLFLANNSATLPALIQHNLFYNNNQSGDASGRGIYTNGGLTGGMLQNVTIDSNAFISNYGAVPASTGLEAAIALQTLAPNEQTNIQITNNVFDANGKAMLFFNTSNVLIQGNVVTYSKDLNSAAIRFEGGDTNVTITGNTLYANPGNVVRIDYKGVPYLNSGFSITGNNFYSDGVSNTGHYYVMVDPQQTTGNVDLSNNWWGTANGPGTLVYAPDGNVITAPFAMTPFNLLTNQAYMQLPSLTDGIIQVENFDQGGEGVAYHDVESANLGLAADRQPFGVDIQTTTDTGGGYNVGYTKAGEWLNYSMNVAVAGTYDLDVRVAYSSAGGQFHFELDGVNITGTMTMPNTGGVQTWKTMTLKGIQLPAGQHVLRLVMDKNGPSGSVGNFNWFNFRNENPVLLPAAPSNLAATLATPTSVNLSWIDNANNETGFIIERSTDGINFTLLTTVPANVTGYIDSTVVASTTYTYRVRATNGTGDSANSNTSSLTMPATQQAVYLSDLPWVSATNGYGPVEIDTNVGQDSAGDGSTITLNGVTYAKGLGTNSVSDITYNLGGQYNFFQADVGLDDHQTVNGSVQFQVFADGVKIYDSGVMGPLSATQSINVSVAGVQQLVLHVGDGGDGSSYDWGDWAGAQLLKSATLSMSAPGGLVAKGVLPTEIDLSWTDIAGETGYRVERSTDGINFAPIGTTAADVTTFADTTVSGTTVYLYRVIATSAGGDSPASNVVSAAPLQPPAAPSSVAATPISSMQVNLSWPDVPLESGFRIERSIDGVNFTPIGTVGLGVLTYSDMTAAASTSYSYRVFATNAAGDSLASNVVLATTPAAPPPPAAPDTLVANAISAKEIDLTWADNSSNETGFIIERSTDGVNFSPLTTTAANVTSYADTSSLAFSTTFYYRVRATNSAGDSANSNTASATTPAPQPPAGPTNLVATSNGSEIDLAWADNSSNETGFIIERSTDGVTFSLLTTTNANVTSYSDISSLAFSTTYSYRVRATNAAGDSQNSNVSSVMTPAPPLPAAPSGLAAAVVSISQINLSWTDNSNNETGFIIERSTDGVTFSLLTTTAANATSYSDTNSLAPGTTYYYCVRATNSFGDSSNSSVASATTPATPPSPVAPNNLVAAAISSSRIDLVWQDTSTNETGFKIERSTDGVNFTQIALIGANLTNYSDTTGLSAGTKYFYRLRATNAGGDSAYSSVASATTASSTALPAGWISADVGPVGIAGSATYTNGTYTVMGAGADIYNTSDGFQFVEEQMTGNFTIIARVASLNNVDANDKAGLMIRDSLAANAKEASVVVTPSNGLKFLRRTSTGGSAASTTVNSLKAPYWLKLTRVGNTITSYYSTNGVSWTSAGSQDIAMNATVYIGLVVTAHKTTAVATATFDNVSIN